MRTIGDKRAQRITRIPRCWSPCRPCSISPEITGSEISRVVPVMTWIVSGDFCDPLGLKVDTLTAVMLLLVTWVAAIVHIYSVGYMSHTIMLRHGVFSRCSPSAC